MSTRETGAYTLDEIADARVAAGMALLDRYSNEVECETGARHWRERIDRDRINVRSVIHCPLAQTFDGDFDAGAQALLDACLIFESDNEDWPIAYGFDEGRIDGVFIGYSRLTAAWRAALPPTGGAALGTFARLAAAWRRHF